MAKVNRHLLLDTAVPPGSGAKEAVDGDPAGFGGANFDANMVIILAALLCALVCALGLNSIVRCALRCSGTLTDEEREQEAAAATVRLGSGMKKSALRKMPVAVYGSDGVKVQDTECPICLAEFVDGEKIRVLPKCNHCFHMRCIDTWLISHSSCPTCRRSLLDGGGGRRADTLVIAVG